MKKNRLFLLGALAITTAFTACKKESATDVYTEQEKTEIAENVVDPENAPVLVLSESNFNYGDVKINESKDHYFVITNEGKSPLVIKDARATCGCTVPEWPKEPIPAGGKDSIKVQFTAGTVLGNTQKKVSLTTNTAQGLEEFTISANVVE